MAAAQAYFLTRRTHQAARWEADFLQYPNRHAQHHQILNYRLARQRSSQKHAETSTVGYGQSTPERHEYRAQQHAMQSNRNPCREPQLDTG
jgi:hypothetical protein